MARPPRHPAMARGELELGGFELPGCRPAAPSGSCRAWLSDSARTTQVHRCPVSDAVTVSGSMDEQPGTPCTRVGSDGEYAVASRMWPIFRTGSRLGAATSKLRSCCSSWLSSMRVRPRRWPLQSRSCTSCSRRARRCSIKQENFWRSCADRSCRAAICASIVAHWLIFTAGVQRYVGRSSVETIRGLLRLAVGDQETRVGN